MDRLTMQAAMNGNLEAQRRINKNQMPAQDQSEPAFPDKGGRQIVDIYPIKTIAKPTDMSRLITINGEIDEKEFARIMLAATQKERAKM